jgi:hypothetical protein
MITHQDERNARASKLLGVIGVICSIWLLAGLTYTLMNAQDAIASLRERWDTVLLTVIIIFSTVRNFQIGRSIRKDS